MIMRKWLISSKIYYETLAAVALTLMAVILSWNSNRLTERQINLLIAQNQPIFRVELHGNNSKAETDSSTLLIYNDGLPVTDLNLDIFETLVVIATVFDGSDNEREVTLHIPTFAYREGIGQTSATKGLLFNMSHETETMSPSKLTYMFQDVGSFKDASYQGADIQVELILRIIYRDIFKKQQTQYIRLDNSGRAHSLSESSGRKAVIEYRTSLAVKIDYRDIDNEKLERFWDHI